MKTIVAVIEKAEDGGYGIYCPELKSVALYGYGLTEQEAKENLSAILEHYEEENEIIPENISGDVSFEYKNGLAYASKTQKKKIETGIYSLSQRLSTVQF